jgi:hypothetical protein
MHEWLARGLINGLPAARDEAERQCLFVAAGIPRAPTYKPPDAALRSCARAGVAAIPATIATTAVVFFISYPFACEFVHAPTNPAISVARK